MAARTSSFSPGLLSLSPSKRSIARHVPPSRPALKSLSGSGRRAPFEKVSFTLSLWALPTAIIPSRDHTGLPIHFHSSMISRSASRMVLRTVASVLPRQSLSDSINRSIRSDGFMDFVPPILARGAQRGLYSTARRLRYVIQLCSLFYRRRLGRDACVLSIQAG